MQNVNQTIRWRVTETPIALGLFLLVYMFFFSRAATPESPDRLFVIILPVVLLWRTYCVYRLKRARHWLAFNELSLCFSAGLLHEGGEVTRDEVKQFIATHWVDAVCKVALHMHCRRDQPIRYWKKLRVISTNVLIQAWNVQYIRRFSYIPSLVRLTAVSVMYPTRIRHHRWWWRG